MKEQIIKKIESEKIIAIIRGMDVDSAIKIASLLHAGGISLIEVTFNQKNPQTFIDTVNSIKGIKQALKDKVSVGAGTVLSIEQVDMAISAGAEYIISPDTDEEVIKYTIEKGLVSLPGAYTPSEAKRAFNAGAHFVKLFPCSNAGYIKALKAPLSHIKFLAVGGVDLQNAKSFIDAGAVGVGVGSSLVNKKWLDCGQEQKIIEQARLFVKEVRGE